MPLFFGAKKMFIPVNGFINTNTIWLGGLTRNITMSSFWVDSESWADSEEWID